ncbi:MAG: acyl-[acyl-carrier-protein]--UDP-N-acetylglucosamine O-acyltransferase, partial [Albidovulum sp.]
MAIHASAQIHDKAHVEPGAEIGAGCVIGPFALIGASVRLAARVEIKNHAVVTGCTEIGDDTVVFPFAVLGEIPQDLKFRGEKTQLVIGARNRVREHVTINTGTGGGGGVTKIGDDCLIMAGAHVAHDCQIGNNVILVNNA